MGQLDFSTDDRCYCPRVGRRHLWAATKNDARYCRENCRPVESSALRSGSHFTRCISIIRTRRPGATTDKKYKVVANLKICVSNFLLHLQSPTVYTPCLHIAQYAFSQVSSWWLGCHGSFRLCCDGLWNRGRNGPGCLHVAGRQSLGRVHGQYRSLWFCCKPRKPKRVSDAYVFKNFNVKFLTDKQQRVHMLLWSSRTSLMLSS